MAKQTDLHQLIHSLTPAEKRYFKVYASMHTTGKSNYEQLFNALNKFPEPYSDSAFKKKHSNKLFAKNLAEEKSHLLELLLKVMRSYEHQQPGEKIYYNQLLDIDFLRRKGLYKPMLQALDKLHKQAADADYIAMQYIAQDIEYHTMHSSSGNLRYNFEQIKHREKQLMKAFALQRQTVILCEQFTHLQKNRLIHQKPLMQKWISQVRALLRQPELNLRSYSRLLKNLSIYYSQIGNWSAAAKINQQGIAIYQPIVDQHPNQATVQQVALYTFNLIADLTTLGRYTQLPALIKKLQQLQQLNLPQTPSKVWLFHLRSCAEMYYCQHVTNKHQCHEISLRVEQGIADLGEMLPQDFIITLYQHMAIMHFYHNQYQQTLHYINLFYNYQYKSPSTQKREALIRCLEIMSHLQLGNQLLVQSQLRNTKRLYRQCRMQTPFFNAVFTFLGHLARQAESINQQSKMNQLSLLAKNICWQEEKSMFRYLCSFLGIDTVPKTTKTGYPLMS
ncbi:MAG: hypothetical protein JNK66_08075 [Chitinophagales bacterium]|nr:hypothetical protein [Chitinophagales bacterium]